MLTNILYPQTKFLATLLIGLQSYSVVLALLNNGSRLQWRSCMYVGLCIFYFSQQGPYNKQTNEQTERYTDTNQAQANDMQSIQILSYLITTVFTLKCKFNSVVTPAGLRRLTNLLCYYCYYYYYYYSLRIQQRRYRSGLIPVFKIIWDM